MSKKPVVLMVLDGYGLSDRKDGNAIAMASTPVMDKLMAECPFVPGNASGLAVGLPDGQMGNSEVGHMNIGAGRIIYQDLTSITKAIEDGTFLRMRSFWQRLKTARSMALTCICGGCSQTAECTATIRICMAFWNYARGKALPMFMCTRS